jgi:hypothetical protein
MRSIWCAGLSCLSRPSIHTHETDQRNQIDQIYQLPATHGNRCGKRVVFNRAPPVVASFRADPMSGWHGLCLGLSGESGCRPLTHSVKKRKDETVRRLVPFRLIPNQGGGEMEDLSPPDRNGSPR